MRILLTLCIAFSMNADVLLVANRGGSTITMIDPETMQLLGTAPVGTDPHEIAVFPDGLRAYVSNFANGNGNTLSVIDVATRTKIKDVDISPLRGPHGIMERGGKIYFTAEGSQSVARYDPAADRVDWVGRTYQDGTHSLAVKHDGSMVYTANVQSASASFVPVTEDPGVYVKSVSTMVLCEGIALSPDGREVWTGSASTGGIAVIDVATETVVARVSPGTFAYRLTFTPDGTTVLVPRNTGVVAVYDAASRTLLRTIPMGGAPTSVLVAADNRTIYVATLAPSRVWKMDLLTGAVLASVAVSNAPDGLAYVAAPHEQTRKRRAVRP